MSDNLENIPIPTNEWVDLYQLSGIAVGTALTVENVGVADVYLAVQELQPPVTHKAYNVLQRGNGIRLKNSAGDLGAWAFCNSESSKVSVAPTDSDGFYPPVTKRTISDVEGKDLILEGNGSMPVTIQDQVTPPVIVYANKVTNTTTLAANTVVAFPQTIEVVSAVGINSGDYLGLFSTVTNRFYTGTVLSILGAVLTLDTPLDSDFLIGDTVGTGIRDLSVDGSITPQTFSLRGADPGVDLTVDITRIILQMTTTDPPEFGKFGDIADGLTNGLVMRRVDGITQNIFNFKLNSEIANIAFDYDVFEQAKPSGVNGLKSRLTFAGQNKMGVVLRVGPADEIEFIVQDDLTQLLSLTVILEGSVAIV